jgi:hypothetical protein
MTEKKNDKSRNDQGGAKGPLERLAQISGKALLQGFCRSIGYHLGTAAIALWWVLLSS